jgi:DNA-binding LytR/AlgR family response regulator
MMTHGIGAGQIIKLEDWLILAGDDITVLSNQAPVQPIQEKPVQPVQAVQAVQEKPVAIGSKFRWDLNHENYRVAIMTSKGLLQVKSVVDGVTDKDTIGYVKTTMFPNEAAWRASLPQDPQGNAAIDLVGPDNRSEIQKRLEAPLRCRFDGDAEKINEFMERFKIRSDILTRQSPNEMVKSALRNIEYFRAELNKITIEEELAGKKRHELSLSLKRALRIYIHNKSKIDRTENPDVGTSYLYVRGTNRLRTNIGGTEYEVGLKGDRLMATQIAIRLVSSKYSPAILYNNLNDLANPKIYMIYRRRRYDLPL